MDKVKETKKQRKLRLAKNERRRIARANAAFQKMSPAEKRVKIAQDVLAQVFARKITPKNGTWVSLFDADYAPAETQVCDIFRKKNCEACALGSLFTCAVGIADNLTVGELFENKDRYQAYPAPRSSMNVEFADRDMKYLEKYFSKFQLALIEAAFECGREGYYGTNLSNPGHPLAKYPNRRNDAYAFGLAAGKGTQDAADLTSLNFDSNASMARLVAIMMNIIQNKGTFNPPSVS